MAVKGPLSIVLGWLVDVCPDLGDNGRAPGQVGNEVAVPTMVKSVSKLWCSVCSFLMYIFMKYLPNIIPLSSPKRGAPNQRRGGRQADLHDVNMKPVGSLLNRPGAFVAELAKVGRQN